MINLYRLVRRHSTSLSIYATGALSAKLVGVITACCGISLLTPEEFGQLSLIQTMLTILPLLFSGGLKQALHMTYFHHKHDSRTLLQTVISSYLIIVLPLIGIMSFILHQATLYTAFNVFVPFIIVYSFFHFFSELLLTIIRIEQRALHATILQLGQAVIVLAFSYMLVFQRHWQVYGILSAQLAGTFFLTTVGLLVAIHHKLFSQWHFDKQKILIMLRLSVPCVPSILFHWLHTSVGRWFLAQQDLAQVGFLSLALSTSYCAHTVILHPLAYTYTPLALKKLNQDNTTLNTIMQHAKLMFSIGVMGLSALIGCISLWGQHALPTTYQQAAFYIAPLLFADLLLLCSHVVSIPYLNAKKSKTLLWFNAAAALVNVMLNFILVPFGGAWAVVISLICSQAFFLGLHLKNYWSVPSEKPKFQ